MVHKTRSNRKANQKRLEEKRKGLPLSAEEIHNRTLSNKIDHQRRYPYPPVYPQPRFGGKGKI